MFDAAVVELTHGFVGLATRVRAFERQMSIAGGHRGFWVSVMASGDAAAPQLVALFADPEGNEVRMTWTAIGDDDVALAVRSDQGGERSLGAYRSSMLEGFELRMLIRAAIDEVVGRIEALTRRPHSRSGAGA